MQFLLVSNSDTAALSKTPRSHRKVDRRHSVILSYLLPLLLFSKNGQKFLSP